MSHLPLSFASSAREAALTAPGAPGAPGTSFAVVGERADEAQLRTVVYALEAALVISAVGAVALGVATSIRERVRDHAILRAVGVSPGQLLVAVSSSSGLIAALGATVGLPLGFGFFRVATAWLTARAMTPHGLRQCPASVSSS